MSDINAVAQAFITHYYGLFDSGKQGISQLSGLYQASSMLSFEGKNIGGTEAIVDHLMVRNLWKNETILYYRFVYTYSYSVYFIFLPVFNLFLYFLWLFYKALEVTNAMNFESIFSTSLPVLISYQFTASFHFSITCFIIPFYQLTPQNLPFQKVKHVPKSIDVQPSGVPGALLVSVQGDLLVSKISRNLS